MQNLWISPKDIQQFTKEVNEGTLPDLGCVMDFYNQVLVHMLPEKRVKAHYYSNCLSQLLVVLINKIKFDPKVLEIYPDIAKTIQALFQIIDPSYSKQVLGQLYGRESDIKQDIKHQQLVFRKYCQSQNMEQLIQRENWFNKDQKSKKIMNASEMVNQELGKNWVDIIDHFQHKKEPNKEKRQKAILNILKNTKTRTLDCLGCVEFMYQSQMVNFQEAQKTDIVLLPSAKTIRQEQLQLKKNICALLNSNGGYILFACIKQKLKVVAKGETLSEVNKQSILQQLNEIFQAFVPKLSFPSNAQLSFVPVAQISKDQEKAQQSQFLEGVYITRLKIWSNKKERVFFFQHSGQLLAFSRFQNHSKAMQIENELLTPHQKLLKYLKKKFKNTQKTEQEQQLDGILRCTQKRVDEHKCSEPYVGKKMSYNPGREVAGCNLYELQTKYKYTSIVIMKNISTSKVVNYMLSQNITRFQFMPAGKQTVKDVKLLFHDTSPYKLQEIIANYNQLKQRASKVLILIVDNALKLQNALKQSQFLELKSYLQNISVNSWLKCFILKENTEQMWFLNCEFKVDIYYIFNYLKVMNINGSRVVRIDTNNKNMSLVYTS